MTNRKTQSFFAGLRDIGETQRVYAIGDSHSLPFGGHFYTHPKLNKTLHVVTKYIPGFRASEACQNGQIDARLLQALVAEKILTTEGTPAHLATDAQTFNVAYAAGEPLVSPSIIMFSGDIDFRSLILLKMNDEFDVDVPGMPTDLTKEIIDGGDIEILAERNFYPLVRCIKQLREMGLDQIFLHCLPEPTLSDEMFFNVNGYVTPWITRKKCTDIWNRILRRLCSIENIPFIDTADCVTVDGKLSPEYELDGCHLAPPAYLHSIERFLNLSLNATSPSLNSSRWSLLAGLAKKSTERPPTSRDDFAEFQLRQEVPSELIGIHTGENSSTNVCPGLDWCGSMRANNVSSTEPSIPALKSLYDVIFDEVNRQSLEAYFGFYFQVINCRLRSKVLDEGELFSTLSQRGLPECLYYGILIIEDTTNTPINPHSLQLLLTFDVSKLVHIDTQPGTLYVSRSNHPQLQLRGTGEQVVKYVDFFFMPRLPNTPPRINWASENCWPIDPFHFSVSQMKAVPEWVGSTERYNPTHIKSQ